MQFSSIKDVVAILENEDQEIFTPEEIHHVDVTTVEQWECPDWYVHKAGIILASKAKKVNDAQSSLNACNSKDVSKLVSEIADPQIPTYIRAPSDSPQNLCDWGLKHEDTT